MKKSDYVPHTCVNFLRIRFEGLLHSLCQNLELDIVSKYNRHTFWSSFKDYAASAYLWSMGSLIKCFY